MGQVIVYGLRDYVARSSSSEVELRMEVGKTPSEAYFLTSPRHGRAETIPQESENVF